MNNIKVNKAKRKFDSIAKGAAMRGLIFDITYQEYLKYYEKNCVYCGITAIGLDRIDSAIGYIKNNIVTCCGICNMMKASLERDAFITHCKRIASLHAHTEHIEEYCDERAKETEYINISTIPHLANLKNYEEKILKECLDKNSGNQTQTAKELNISTTTLWRKIKKYHITVNSKCNS